jgi:hypothetical protein
MAQLCDGTRQHTRRHMPVAPDGVEQLVVANQLAGMAQQVEQHREGFRLERLRLAVASQRVGGGIDHEWAEAIALATVTRVCDLFGGFHQGNLTNASASSPNAAKPIAAAS